MQNMKKTQKKIDQFLKKFVLTKKQGANGGALKMALSRALR